MTSDDPMFAHPYEDVDEWRDTPVRHRYVHGGFEGTDTRYSIYLPPADAYDGRFFQHITPVPDSENLAQQGQTGPDCKIGFAISSGAYFLETNGGGPNHGFGQGDSTVTAYRANAAAAQRSRVIAAEMYGPHRPYGYAYGGSGGAYRTVGSMQNTDGVWDGTVPHVMGSPVAIPNVFTVRLQAMRILRDRFDDIVDAVEPGGSGDPYAGLDDRERAALGELERMGMPLAALYAHRTMGQHGFTALYGGIRAADRAYFDEFWTTPGYLGHDDPGHFEGDRVRHAATVVALVTEGDIEHGHRPGEPRGNVDNAYKATNGSGRLTGFVLDSVPATDVESANLVITSGAAAGESLILRKIDGSIATVDPALHETLARVEPGDSVEIDNIDLLAVHSYHRHQDPGPQYPVWDQFRTPDGEPMYPQRPLLLGPLFTQAASGALPSGEVKGKMILVESLWDREAFPWQADWYRQRVVEQHGDGAADRFRVWMVDRALHGDLERQDDETRVVSYMGVLHRALQDVAAWVEQGIEPPADTVYDVVDGQVVVPPTAAERLGVQPVVRLLVAGADRADVAPGEPVRVDAAVDLPPGGGTVVEAAFAIDDGDWHPLDVPDHRTGFELSFELSALAPGTHFVACRVTAQRDGDHSTAFGRIHHLDRVRVVVHP